MPEQFANERKNIKPGLLFENLAPQIAEHLSMKENVQIVVHGNTQGESGPRLPRLPRMQKIIAKNDP